MTPSTPTVAELMASHKSQGSTPQHAYDALGETFPSLPVNTKIGLVGAYYGPNAEAQLKPNPPATKPVPEPSSVIDNDNKPTFGDLKVMHEMHSVASSPDNTKQAKLDYLHSIHEDTYSNAVGEYKEALLHHLATPVAGLPSNPHNVPPPPIGGSPDMLKLYDAAQHSNPQEAIAQVKAAWIGSKAEAAYSQDLINHLTDVVNGNPQASSDVPPPPTHTVQGWEIGVGSPTGIAYAEMHSLAVEGMKQTTVAGVQAAMSTIHANFPNDLAYKSTLLAHLGNKLTELGDQHPHGIEPFTAMFPRGTLLPGSPATKETKALYEASEQPNAELALEAVVATPAISGYGMQYKDAIIQHLEAKTQNPLSSPQPSGLMPATQAQVTAHLQPKPPKAPVQTGTSSGALWAQNKIQQLTSASNSSDPINAILAVSMTKTTPKYLKKYQADLLAHHQALGTQKGSAAPASTPLSGKIAAVKPKMPPLPDAPPVDTASGKYTPEQQKLYTEKVASLKAAAAGPNPLVAIDKIQGASGAIQTYKSALINHIMAHAPVPDAIIGQTVSSYKIVGEHALPQPAKFKVQSQSSLEHLATYRHNLPPTLRKAVDSYKGSGYQALNAHRFNPGAPLPSHHKALDKALYGGQLDRDTLLTRRISSKALGSIAKSLEGKIFTDPAYGSTSYAEHTWHGNVVLKINAPKGTRGIFFTSEHEWLLPRNTRYRVFKVENTSSGETVIHTELLPPHEQVEIPTGD